MAFGRLPFPLNPSVALSPPFPQQPLGPPLALHPSFRPPWVQPPPVQAWVPSIAGFGALSTSGTGAAVWVGSFTLSSLLKPQNFTLGPPLPKQFYPDWFQPPPVQAWVPTGPTVFGTLAASGTGAAAWIGSFTLASKAQGAQPLPGLPVATQVAHFYPPWRQPPPVQPFQFTGPTVFGALSSSGTGTASWVGAFTLASLLKPQNFALGPPLPKQFLPDWFQPPPVQAPGFFSLASSQVNATWSASGTGTATWIGAAENDQVWSSAGIGAAAWIGAAENDQVWSSSGTGTAAWVGSFTLASAPFPAITIARVIPEQFYPVWRQPPPVQTPTVFSSSGVTLTGVWSTSGTGTATWAGAAENDQVWGATGLGAASWTSAATNAQASSAAGSSSVNWVSNQVVADTGFPLYPVSGPIPREAIRRALEELRKRRLKAHAKSTKKAIKAAIAAVESAEGLLGTAEYVDNGLAVVPSQSDELTTLLASIDQIRAADEMVRWAEMVREQAERYAAEMEEEEEAMMIMMVMH